MHRFLFKKLMARLLSLKPPIFDPEEMCNGLLVTLKPKVNDPFSEDVLCAPRLLNIVVYFNENTNTLGGWIITKYREIDQNVVCQLKINNIPSIDVIMSFIFNETIQSVDIANGEHIIECHYCE